MRTNNYLWAMLAAATLTLTGCGSDENGITEPQLQEKTAHRCSSIVLTIQVLKTNGE